ncbi:urease accessory protein UreD [Caenimonas aquaedulcis]|uniref:Urease accessory protein UreD n=1 Tax=Caenimonas aquaedulcis TaxID=2793270 RepID=A0A931H4I1_9BURK|nr:urease accessory protein UreD [Caenimonas aquaedulcis]MBG9388343.1 urease accessory protein UreD [Caenimonas aquaedulcis]
MAWHARLSLDYRMEGHRCVSRFEHDGPLRILQSLYPEGDALAHNVVVHPPGGLVGGDTLEISVRARAGSHGLVTTPGATRFYRSDGEAALQRTRIVVEDGARIEWLPLEAICHNGCIAHNLLSLQVAPGGEAMGWDVAALGLPASGQPFVNGSLLQHVELEGAWLERGRIAAKDAALMDGPLGLAGHRCTGTLFFAAGTEIPRARRDAVLEAARAVIDAHELSGLAGATAPGPRVIVVRVLAPLVEPALQLLKLVRDAWRPLLWQLPATRPRTWAL